MTLKKEQQHRHAATPHNGSYSSSEADSVLAGLVLTLMDSRRNGRMPTRRASILKVTRSFSWASSHSSRTVRPSTNRSEEHTSELQSLMRISYAVFCLTNKNNSTIFPCTYR